MSADRHRGIRREKQKRAKDAKRQSRRQYTPAGTAKSPDSKAAEQPSA